MNIEKRNEKLVKKVIVFFFFLLRPVFLLVWSCIWMSFENHGNTLTAGSARGNNPQLAVFADQTIGLVKVRIEKILKNRFDGNGMRTEVSLPCAWPNEHRSRRTDVQSIASHPNCSIYSNRADRLFRPGPFVSGRTSPSRALSNSRRFVPNQCERP